MKLLLRHAHSKGIGRHEVLTLGVIEDCTLATFIVGSFVATATKVGRRIAGSNGAAATIPLLFVAMQRVPSPFSGQVDLDALRRTGFWSFAGLQT